MTTKHWLRPTCYRQCRFTGVTKYIPYSKRIRKLYPSHFDKYTLQVSYGALLFISTLFLLWPKRMLPITPTFASTFHFHKKKILVDLIPRCVHILNIYISHIPAQTHKFKTNICPSTNTEISDWRSLAYLPILMYTSQLSVSVLITLAVALKTDMHIHT
jgi:hypothetical protein